MCSGHHHPPSGRKMIKQKTEVKRRLAPRKVIRREEETKWGNAVVLPLVAAAAAGLHSFWKSFWGNTNAWYFFKWNNFYLHGSDPGRAHHPAVARVPAQVLQVDPALLVLAALDPQALVHHPPPVPLAPQAPVAGVMTTAVAPAHRKDYHKVFLIKKKKFHNWIHLLIKWNQHMFFFFF